MQTIVLFLSLTFYFSAYSFEFKPKDLASLREFTSSTDIVFNSNTSKFERVKFYETYQTIYFEFIEAKGLVDIATNLKVLKVQLFKFDVAGRKIRNVYDFQNNRSYHFNTDKAYKPRVLKQTDIAVAVFDTGVDYNHPQLLKNISENKGYDYIDQDSFPFDMGLFPHDKTNAEISHGTAVANLIVQEYEKTEIIPYRVQTHFIDAVEDAAKYGVKLINISLGLVPGLSLGEIWGAILNHPEILFVVAAGNSHVNTDLVFTIPATLILPNILVVGSLNETETDMANFSNYGASSVDIAVKGEKIPTYLAMREEEQFMNGTSFSAPIVTGTLARVLASNPEYTPEDLKELIRKKAKPYPKLLYGTISIRGLQEL